jgi:hypothetical protein
MLLCLGVAGYVYAHTNHPPKPIDRLVTFHDRGQERVILTHANSVQAALKDAKITVGPQDVVEPALGTELLSTDSAVIIYRARLVMVVDGASRQRVITAAAAPSEIVAAAGITTLHNEDKTTFRKGDFVSDGASSVLTIERAALTPNSGQIPFKPSPNALTKGKGAQLFTDSSGVVHRETYYDLPMNVVIGSCGPGGYTIRSDGAKIDKDGYILVAASYRVYPRCSIVETSMGLGKVYDTGGFALRYPHGFDLATDWSRADGR